MVDEKRELHVELWVKRSKVNLPATFCVNILIHLGQCFFVLCTQIQDDERKVLGQTVINQGQ